MSEEDTKTIKEIYIYIYYIYILQKMTFDDFVFFQKTMYLQHSIGRKVS